MFNPAIFYFTFLMKFARFCFQIYVKLIDKSDNWSGVIRFGYTSHDPATLKDRLPKYACPGLYKLLCIYWNNDTKAL